LAQHRKRQENNVHGTNGAGVVNMQSKPKAKRTNAGKCQGEHVHGTSWIAEGNKQNKRQTCFLLALLVPFRSPVSGIHWNTLGKLIKHCLHHALHMYKCAYMDMFFLNVRLRCAILKTENKMCLRILLAISHGFQQMPQQFIAT
jgi:hypothetical protein